MKLKFWVISFFTLFLVTAADPFFGTDLSWSPVPKETPGDVKERQWMSTDAFKEYLHDEDDRVSNIFNVSSYYYPSVNFWFMIYTQFGSDAVVVHDKTNLSLIYKVLDFSSLHEKKLPKNTIYVLQNKITEERKDDLRKILEDLSKDPYSLSPEAKKIYRILKFANVAVPIRKSDRSIFFTKLKHNLRTQTGQKNFIHDGMVRSLPYQSFLSQYFTDRKLPKELLAIPFLESSFNPKAHSKVNALGVWQFMPLIASYYVPKRTDNTDYRSNVGIASLAAGFLMSENFSIMKSWDLAVTAYNSGTKHLLKTKRELASSNVNLEAVIKHSDSGHFGFASKNFYSEFLALAHTLAYRDELFPDLHDSERSDVDEELKFYITKCSLRLEKTTSKDELDDIDYHNHQIGEIRSQLPRGYLITAKSELSKKFFSKIHYKDLLKTKPKDWGRFLANQSCSTR